MLFNNVSSTAAKNTFLVQVQPPALFSGKKAELKVISSSLEDAETQSKNSSDSPTNVNE